MKSVRIDCVVGARPNFIKIAPILREMKRRPRFEARLIHTGQHFSPEMSESFFHDLEIPEPDINLGVGGGTHTAQTAEIMRRLEPVFAEKRPDLVLVVGDVNSTMAAALVAVKMGIAVGHVEAGLRSFDRRMPEEINRLVTDAVADYLFVSEPSGEKNLRAEGVAERKIFFVGNVMIDTLERFREKAAQSAAVARLGMEANGYALVTLHRPSNVDEPARLRELVEMLGRLAQRLPVVFPVHPRTRARMEGLNTDSLVLTPPLGYLDFLKLMMEARLVLTDSGGIQEETTVLGVPCLTLRENTERPVTIEQGTNRLVGSNLEEAFEATQQALDCPRRQGPPPELWDGKTSNRILDVLEKLF